PSSSFARLVRCKPPFTLPSPWHSWQRLTRRGRISFSKNSAAAGDKGSAAASAGGRNPKKAAIKTPKRYMRFLFGGVGRLFLVLRAGPLDRFQFQDNRLLPAAVDDLAHDARTGCEPEARFDRHAVLNNLSTNHDRLELARRDADLFLAALELGDTVFARDL